MKINKIYKGDALVVLRTFPDESIDCAITSPPYWALRDYGTASWDGGDEKCKHETGHTSPMSTLGGGKTTQNTASFYKNKCGKCGAKRVDKQLGLEPTFQEYITRLCDIFDEVKRVLKKSGTCWVNMGDTYGGTKDGNTEETKNPKLARMKTRKAVPHLEKSLVQIPSRFAIEMSNRGWILRNEIIWYKPNCMPSSATDRFTVDFEKIFFFVKNKKYAFEQQYQSYADSSFERYKYAVADHNVDIDKRKQGWVTTKNRDERKIIEMNPLGVNKRAVWTMNTKPYPDAHFAVFPEKLVEIPIKAGCPEGGVVLDPFIGSGTTGLVAKKLKRNWVGIELNPEYVEMAESRIASQTEPML